MRRRSVIGAILILLAAIVLTGGFAVFLLKNEPAFYTRPGCSDPFASADQAARTITHVQDLKNSIRLKSNWGETFREDELNCLFREHFTANGSFVGLLPDRCTDPRIAIEGDRVKLGVRHGQGTFSVVLWVEFRAWLVKTEPNCIAIELMAIRAGSVPVNSQAVLDSISEAARDSNIEVSWYRNEGRPVGLFRFYADQLRPTSQILGFKIENGTITIAGKSQVDPALAETLDPTIAER